MVKSWSLTTTKHHCIHIKRFALKNTKVEEVFNSFHRKLTQDCNRIVFPSKVPLVIISWKIYLLNRKV